MTAPDRESGARRVARESLTSYARYAVVIAVQIALVPFMISALGDEGYGLWTLSFSVLGFLSLADFGLTTGVVRFVAECKGSGDVDRRNRMLSTVAMIYLALAAGCVAVLAAFTPIYAGAFDIPEATRADALAVLWILAGRSVAVSLPLAVWRSAVFGDRHVALFNAIEAIGTVAWAVGAYAVLASGGGIVWVAWANLAALAIQFGSFVVAAYRLVPDLRVSWRLADRRLLGEAAAVGLSQLVVSVSALVLLRAAPMVVQLRLGLAEVALYGVALKVAENVLMLFKQGVHVLAPVAAELKGRGDEAAIRRVVLSGSRLTFAPAAIVAALGWALGGAALSHWIGPDYARGGLVLGILLTAMALLMPQTVASTVFTMTGLHRLTSYAAMASVALNLALSVALVLRVGLEGVALGTLGATLIVDVGAIAWLTRRFLRVPYGEMARRVLWPALPPAAAAFAVSAGLVALRPPGSLAEVVGYAVPGGAIAAALFWRFGADPAERALFRRRAQPAAGRPEPSRGDTVPPPG